jgi:hypothetical protein
MLQKILKSLVYVLLFALLALPSALLLQQKQIENQNNLIRQTLCEYLTFSHSMHMRSFWAMTNLDYAMEAARNSGDYGQTTEYFPLYANRALTQTEAALEEIESIRNRVPSEAAESYEQLTEGMEGLNQLATTLNEMPGLVVPSGDLIRGERITTWSSREALRIYFASLESSLKSIRGDAVSVGYEWSYSDMLLKALYNIVIEQGQTMFQSSSF